MHVEMGMATTTAAATTPPAVTAHMKYQKSIVPLSSALRISMYCIIFILLFSIVLSGIIPWIFSYYCPRTTGNTEKNLGNTSNIRKDHNDKVNKDDDKKDELNIWKSWDTNVRKLTPAFDQYLLKTYSKFHSEQLLKYRSSTKDSKNDVKFLIWTCKEHNCAGMGDRYRGIILTYVLSVITSRVFLIEWPKQEINKYRGNWGNLKDALEPNHIEWDIADLGLERGVTLLWYTTKPRKHFQHTAVVPHVDDLAAPPEDSRWWKDDTGFDYGKSNRSMSLVQSNMEEIWKDIRVVRLSTRLSLVWDVLALNPYLKGVKEMVEDAQFQGLKDWDVKRAITRWLFRPSHSVRQAIESFKTSRHFTQKLISNSREPLIGTRYFSMHVRLGGDFDETGDPRFQRDNSDKIAAAQRLLRCLQLVGYKRGNVFLASDSQEFKKVIHNQANGTGLHFVYKDGPVLHIARPGAYPFKQNSINQINPFVEMFADILLLGSADTILSNVKFSGFTWLAYHFGSAASIVRNAAGNACEIENLRKYTIYMRSVESIMRSGM